MHVRAGAALCRCVIFLSVLGGCARLRLILCADVPVVLCLLLSYEPGMNEENLVYVCVFLLGSNAF